MYIYILIKDVFFLGERELHCPRCRKITFLDDGGVEALPINYDLQGVVEAMPEDFSPSTPVLAFGQALLGITSSDTYQ